MSIEIYVDASDEVMAREMGMTVEEFRRKLAILNGGGTLPGAETPERPAVVKGRYRYTAGDSRSGTCAICAPYIGMETDGTGQDGVPVPPLHPNCVCTLVPLALDGLGTDVSKALKRRFEWMKDLNERETRAVVGEARAELLKDKLVTLSDLYDEAGQLVSLDMLDIDPATGWLSVNQAAVITGISHEGVKTFATRGTIPGARRIGQRDWLIPVDWARKEAQ